MHTPLPIYKGCLVCGQSNENASRFGIKFHMSEEGAQADFILDESAQGYEGISHGGVISGILDECSAWAAFLVSKKFHVTQELKIKYSRPVVLGRKYKVFSKVLSENQGLRTITALIKDKSDRIMAESEGLFFELSEERSKLVSKYLTFAEDDLKI